VRLHKDKLYSVEKGLEAVVPRCTMKLERMVVNIEDVERDTLD
jgi:hypothetical protein